MTIEELASKIEWEGGIMEAVDYGIKVADLPEDIPVEIRDAWQRMRNVLADVDLVQRWLWDQGF